MWWRSTKDRYVIQWGTRPGGDIEMSWPEFTQVFQEQYISDTIKDLKQAKFDALRYDNLSVLEYEHKFN